MNNEMIKEIVVAMVQSGVITPSSDIEKTAKKVTDLIKILKKEIGENQESDTFVAY
ncbi:hypothetical protein [Clostridium cylindrosporum]|uniref:Uncharacterized protein n=1 Tax=Clostridium cylindrosporum DSM 605 TaxID=1121307 RepID=A0A0J8DA94_CLOCY|nr:hypothetical protein [Clostridium cylindrosporum]KMT22965.1 hypothetical protein CLCY_7c00120 [Clostridium cylindrosporum DSM 605]